MPKVKRVYPSIAQLEERGTVICNLALSAIPRSLVRTRLEGYFSFITPPISRLSNWYSIRVLHSTMGFATILVPSQIITLCYYFKEDNIHGSQSPIQLLRPPGLCSDVCPILTTPVSTLEPSPTRFATSLESWSPVTRKGLSIASISGLGGTNGVDVAVTKEPCPSTLGKGPTFGVSAGGRSTGRNDSAYHSYHTCRWSVRRHKET